MSVLPAGVPLASYVPDLADLLADPRGYLQAGTLAIGPRRLSHLANLFGLPGLALLTTGLGGRAVDAEQVALGVGLLLGAAFWVGWALCLRGTEVVLLPEGVELTAGGCTVRAPWAVFSTLGAEVAFDPRQGLILPVKREALAGVELIRGHEIIARGEDVRVPQWRLTAAGEVVLEGRYAVASAELGALLLLLGRRLGRDPA